MNAPDLRISDQRTSEPMANSIGIFSQSNDLDTLHERIATAAEQGFGTFWMPQIFGVEALTALAVAAKDVPDIRVGTAVIPIQPRHPMMLAQHALTTNQVLGGRLDLGIGLSHQMVTEGMWGISWKRSYTHMSEYLDALVPLMNGEAPSIAGDIVTSRGGLDPIGAAPRLLLAALGPKMLELTGRMADGTILWMTGPKTISAHIAPTINAAAEAAGRPAPEVVAALPVCVTDDVDAARARADEVFAIYGQLPSYRAMMDREGVDGPSGLALVGSADQVQDQISTILDAGATCFVASEFGEGDEAEATRDALRALL